VGIPQALRQLGEVHATLRDIRTLLRDLTGAARFQRGGYDGPFVEATQHTVTAAAVAEIFRGRGTPMAVLLQTDATTLANTYLYVSTDSGNVRGGWRIPVTANAEQRIICDGHQRLFAHASDATVTLRVIVGKL